MQGRSGGSSLPRLQAGREPGHNHAAGENEVQMIRLLFAAFLPAVLALLLASAPARAAQCGGDFNAFLAAMAREAQAAGVSRAVIETAFAGVALDQNVLAFDRRQRGTFRKSFEEYTATRVNPSRVNRGRQALQKHAQLLARVEAQYGVPKELLVAIWGLESDYGAGDIGKLPVVRVLATMAHDCRRTERFQGELIAALKILQRGDLTLNTMIGAYAGELGQTQFLPSNYIKYGVDYDGDGRIDLRRSVPDVLASTANLLKSNGWQRGQPFGEGTANFQAMREWNNSELYRRVMHYFAERLASGR
jgi:lytic murein transglycosylase